MYVSAGHIPVKMDQDRAWSINGVTGPLVVLCDGIGEYAGSGQVADLLLGTMQEKVPVSRAELESCLATAMELVREKGITGGTTLLSCHRETGYAEGEGEWLAIHHLGNGAVLHLSGDFHALGPSHAPFKVRHVVLPHVNEQGALTRHVSHNSGPEQLRLSGQLLKLDQTAGDIVLLVTDGITSLEEEMLIKHEGVGYLRVQSESLQYVLRELHSFLQAHCNSEAFAMELERFVKEVLEGLKGTGILDDDAALGLVVTDDVLGYYRKHAE